MPISYVFVTATLGTGVSDNIQRTPKCMDKSGYHTRIFTESADQVLCFADTGKCHKDALEGASTTTVWR